MANMLDSGAAWLLQQLQQSAGRTATYIRNGKRIAITAVRVAQDESVLDANGIPIRVVDHELTVDAAALPWEYAYDPQNGFLVTSYCVLRLLPHARAAAPPQPINLHT